MSKIKTFSILIVSYDYERFSKQKHSSKLLQMAVTSGEFPMDIVLHWSLLQVRKTKLVDIIYFYSFFSFFRVFLGKVSKLHIRGEIKNEKNRVLGHFCAHVG